MEQTQTKAEKLAEDGSRETKSQGNADAAVAVENQLAEMELNATANERAGKEETVYSDLSFGMMANSGYPKVYQFTKDIPTESICGKYKLPMYSWNMDTIPALEEFSTTKPHL